jgi:hypothetical protein
MKVGFSNKVYNVLKFIALVLLPAAGSLYFALSGIWNLPDVTQVVGTISVVDTFLGGVLGLSSRSYSAPVDGHVTVDDSDPDLLGMNVQLKNPQEVAGKSSVHLKVVQGPLPASPIPGPHGGN